MCSPGVGHVGAMTADLEFSSGGCMQFVNDLGFLFSHDFWPVAGGFSHIYIYIYIHKLARCLLQCCQFSVREGRAVACCAAECHPM